MTNEEFQAQNAAWAQAKSDAYYAAQMSAQQQCRTRDRVVVDIFEHGTGLRIVAAHRGRDVVTSAPLRPDVADAWARRARELIAGREASL